MLKFSPRNIPGRRNLLAACATVFCVAILHSSFDTLPAGEDVANATAAPLKSFAEEQSVPLPPGVQGTEATIDSTADSETSATDQRTDGTVLNDMETLKFCTLLLKDGARQMEELDDYTVVFNKEERINGDLQEPQSIDMKVQHSPHFAVYMKWRVGDRGRQVLYSDEYEDGSMVVKFGGLRRILPALRIDPNCANAKAESRYPVTQAGVVGMIRQILTHRERDLKRGHGLTCVRLPDQEFDQRKCYSFLIQYEDPKFCKMYRKSLINIDARHHIPLMVRNFTWANDAEGQTEAELDRNTLIENYSFTNLNLSTELVAIDFSRENPRYRM